MAAANPTSSAVFDPSIFDCLWWTRTALKLLKWLGWGALCSAAAAVVLLACAAAYLAFAEHRRRKAALARRKRLRRRMMSTVRDAPYEQMLAARIIIQAKPCVVCRREYEAGETCSVLPRCAHVFHRHCIAAWLRHHNTCPICNAAVLVALPAATS
ncbi:unnamed protein product [Urochloa decumbens]|uniref:RING-type domain-containing protein n=1 Tax=Urochloa decumbens TaxID=240449 RepID=A0ABC9HCD5_9POAL